MACRGTGRRNLVASLSLLRAASTTILLWKLSNTITSWNSVTAKSILFGSYWTTSPLWMFFPTRAYSRISTKSRRTFRFFRREDLPPQITWGTSQGTLGCDFTQLASQIFCRSPKSRTSSVLLTTVQLTTFFTCTSARPRLDLFKSPEKGSTTQT